MLINVWQLAFQEKCLIYTYMIILIERIGSTQFTSNHETTLYFVASCFFQTAFPFLLLLKFCIYSQLMSLILTWTLTDNCYVSKSSNIFAKSGNSFQILEEYFLSCLCYSYRHGTLWGLICIISIFLSLNPRGWRALSGPDSKYFQFSFVANTVSVTAPPLCIPQKQP